MFGWTNSELPLLISLPILLIGSAFFSGSETALFGLTHNERDDLRRKGTIASTAIESLLHQPRMLLITVLLGNMVINVLYFVISSVLLLRTVDTSWFAQAFLAVATLLVIVIFGEVIPKLLANTTRIRFASFVAPPMLALHQIILPLREGLNKLVVEPLSRLTAPTSLPPELDHTELHELLEQFGGEGVIDDDEQRMLRDVVGLGDRRVKSVMTPRVRLHALPHDASRDDVLELARETKLTKFPIFQEDLDNIVGILHVKRFLLDKHEGPIIQSRAVTRPRFVPELAAIDRVLIGFRKSRTQLAIVVDEYGGTAGIIAIEDIVREIVGDLRDIRVVESGEIEQLAEDEWQVGGDVDLRDLRTAIGDVWLDEDAGSVGGLIVKKLGHIPARGERIQFEELELIIQAVIDARIKRVLVRRLSEDQTDDMHSGGDHT